MYSGQAAINYLSSKAMEIDKNASSHWRKYHSTFQLTPNGFKGLQGFGGCRSPRGFLFTALELQLQSRFRKMGGADFSTIDKIAGEITRQQFRIYDLDVLRQSLTISFIRDAVPNLLSPKSVGCVIGDGFGSMTSLLIASKSVKLTILINLTKTLLVDLHYLKLWMGEERFEKSVELVTDEKGLESSLGRFTSEGYGGVIAIQASDHQLLQHCPIDFALNLVSMQEMDPPIIDAYFNDLRSIALTRRLYFYCCNREEKFLPDGTVTRFSSYPWKIDDEVLVDELCPWHQEYYSLKPPFFRPYDGPIRHRLALLKNI